MSKAMDSPPSTMWNSQPADSIRAMTIRPLSSQGRRAARSLRHRTSPAARMGQKRSFTCSQRLSRTGENRAVTAQGSQSWTKCSSTPAAQAHRKAVSSRLWVTVMAHPSRALGSAGAEIGIGYAFSAGICARMEGAETGHPVGKGGIFMTPEEYQKLVREQARPSPLLRDMAAAFCVGGAICAGGQGLLELYQHLGLDRETAGTAVSLTLIVLSALLTGLGQYDKIAKFAGAGTLVPITGFANAMVSPAMEFKHEGMITGTAAKLFVIAGPVLVCGLSASVVYGAVLWAAAALWGG